jgi:hypothetical protein
MVTTADHVPGPPQGRWTYEAYAALHTDERYEIINGVLYTWPLHPVRHINLPNVGSCIISRFTFNSRDEAKYSALPLMSNWHLTLWYSRMC